MARSLVPLADESLAGFVLRLAHRLELPPGHVAWRTGLTRDAYHAALAPSRHLIMMEPRQLTRFAEATRMTPQAADRLTLRRFIDHYPPIAEILLRRGNEVPRPRGPFPAWLLMDSTRYCPACLQGDGSLIQNLHGGAWKQRWRLPFVFACLEHQVLLCDNCPACGLPAQSGYQGHVARLMPAPAAAGLHPAQCRNSPTGNDSGPRCGHRLDRHDGLKHTALTPQLDTLQRRLLSLLSPDQDPAAAFAMFSDIRVMASIITAAWPLANPVVPLDDALTGAFSEHCRLHKNLPQAVAPPRLRGSRRPDLWSAEPRSAAAMAELLSIIDPYLGLPADEFRQAMAPLTAAVPHPTDPLWGPTWRILQNHSSPLFRHQIENAFHRRFPLHPTPGWSDRRDHTHCVISVHPRGYQPEHIPQDLPEDWFQLFLDNAAPNPEPMRHYRHIRRAVAVQLVQAVSGMRLHEAALILGIPADWIGHYPSPLPLAPFRTSHCKPPYNIPGALERLASHISALPQQTNYAQRRERFADWHLGAESWNRIRDDIPGFLLANGPQRKRLDQQLRNCTSAAIWSQLTGSEWRLAPCFTPPQPPPNDPLARGTYESQFLHKLNQQKLPSFATLAKVIHRQAERILAKPYSQ